MVSVCAFSRLELDVTSLKRINLLWVFVYDMWRSFTCAFLWQTRSRSIICTFKAVRRLCTPGKSIRPAPALPRWLSKKLVISSSSASNLLIACQSRIFDYYKLSPQLTARYHIATFQTMKFIMAYKLARALHVHTFADTICLVIRVTCGCCYIARTALGSKTKPEANVLLSMRREL